LSVLNGEYERLKEALRESKEAMSKYRDEVASESDAKLLQYEAELTLRRQEVERISADLTAQCTQTEELQEKLNFEEMKSFDLDEKVNVLTDEFNFFKIQHAQLLAEEKSKLNASRISEGENSASFEREILRLNTVLSVKSEEYFKLEGLTNNIQSEVDVLKEEKWAQIEKERSKEDSLLLTMTSSANDMESLNMMIQDLDLAVNNANKIISELQEEIINANKSNTELQEEISNANKSNSELQEGISNANKIISDLQEEISNANKSNTELQEEISNANKIISDLQEEISNANKSNTELQEEIISANKSNTELQEEISNANKSNSELQEEIDSVNILNESNYDEIMNLKALNREIEEGKSSLEAALREREERILAIQGNHTEFSGEVEELKKTVESLKEQIINITTLKDAELASKSDELASKNAEIASKSDEIASKILELASKSDEFASKNAELACIQEKYSLLEREIKEKIENIVRLENEILTQKINSDNIDKKDSNETFVRDREIELENEIETLKSLLETEKIESESLRHEIENLQLMVEEESVELLKSVESLTEKETEINRLKLLIADKEEKEKSTEPVEITNSEFGESESVINTLSKEVTELKELLETKITEISELQLLVRTKNTDFYDLDQSAQRQISRIDELSLSLHDSGREINELQVENENFKYQNAQLHLLLEAQTLDPESPEIDRVQSDENLTFSRKNSLLDELKSVNKLKALESTIHEKDTEIENKIRDNEALQLTLHKKIAEIEILKSQISLSNTEIAGIRCINGSGEIEVEVEKEVEKEGEDFSSESTLQLTLECKNREMASMEMQLLDAMREIEELKTVLCSIEAEKEGEKEGESGHMAASAFTIEAKVEEISTNGYQPIPVDFEYENGKLITEMRELRLLMDEKENQSTELRSVIDRLESEITVLNTEISSKTNQAEEMRRERENENENNVELIRVLEREVEERENDITELSAKLIALENYALKNDKVEEMDEEDNNRVLELGETETERETDKETQREIESARERDEELLELRLTSEERKRYVMEIRVALEEKEIEIDDLRFSLEECERARDSALEASKDKEVQIAELKSIVLSSKEELKLLSRSIKENNSEIERLKSPTKSHGKKALSVINVFDIVTAPVPVPSIKSAEEDEGAKIRAEMREKKREITALEESIDGKRGENDELCKGITRLNTEVEEMQSSTRVSNIINAINNNGLNNSEKNPVSPQKLKQMKESEISKMKKLLSENKNEIEDLELSILDKTEDIQGLRIMANEKHINLEMGGEEEEVKREKDTVGESQRQSKEDSEEDEIKDENRIITLQNDLLEKEKEIYELNSVISAKDIELDELLLLVGNKDNEIYELKTLNGRVDEDEMSRIFEFKNQEIDQLKGMATIREKENEELNSLVEENRDTISLLESTIALKITEIEGLKNISDISDLRDDHSNNESKGHGIGNHGFDNKNHGFQLSMVEDFQEYDAFTGKTGRMTADIPTENSRDFSTDLDLSLRDKEEELEVVRSDFSNTKAALSLLEYRCYEAEQKSEQLKSACDELNAENDNLKYSLKAVADKLMKDDKEKEKENEIEKEIGRERERERAAEDREKKEEELRKSQESEVEADRLQMAMAQADILRQQLLQVIQCSVKHYISDSSMTVLF
jgi:chromosome segregation ATPase